MYKIKNFIVVLGLYITISLLISCSVSENNTTSNTMEGYWQSTYGDGFEIKDGNFFQYDDASKTIGFSGVIVSSTKLDESKGYITVQIKNSGSWNFTLDYYTVISWKNFNGSECKESTPYKAGGVSYLPDRSAAESEFKIENGYYEVYGTYVKQ